MPDYFELAAPPRLAASVECFWVMRHSGETEFSHRVTSDGCADIIFTSGSGKPTLQAVGAMTKFDDFAVLPGQLVVGVRFHPGMWAVQFGVPADRLTDLHPSLEELWGKRARSLGDRLENAITPLDRVEILAGLLNNGQMQTPMQRALSWMRSQHGQVSLDSVADQAGLSARQFRRLCLQQTGLSPKLLARILRFRRALTKIQSGKGNHAALAADCGYFDQSHLIAEFQRFSGQTPASFLR